MTPMTLPDPFRRAGEHISIGLPGAHVLFTTRRGGVSTGPFRSLNLGWLTDDEPEAVEVNRARVARHAGVAPDRLAHGRQVHGRRVRAVARASELGAPPVESDGQATSVPRVAPIVLVADCLPVAVAGEGAVAMLHCGWRGLAAGIVETGIQTLRELGAAGPLGAAIGPGAGACCYEVGEEVHHAFADAPAEAHLGHNLDLKLIAAAQLRAAGVDDVHDAALCTLCADPELFFSHRRDRGVTGRQAGVVWRA
jgi:YfiH family protein